MHKWSARLIVAAIDRKLALAGSAPTPAARYGRLVAA